jgi:hypothetical protein
MRLMDLDLRDAPLAEAIRQINGQRVLPLVWAAPPWAAGEGPAPVTCRLEQVAPVDALFGVLREANCGLWVYNNALIVAQGRSVGQTVAIGYGAVAFRNSMIERRLSFGRASGTYLEATVQVFLAGPWMEACSAEGRIECEILSPSGERLPRHEPPQVSGPTFSDPEETPLRPSRRMQVCGHNGAYFSTGEFNLLSEGIESVSIRGTVVLPIPAEIQSVVEIPCENGTWRGGGGWAVVNAELRGEEEGTGFSFWDQIWRDTSTVRLRPPEDLPQDAHLHVTVVLTDGTTLPDSVTRDEDGTISVSIRINNWVFEGSPPTRLRIAVIGRRDELRIPFEFPGVPLR